MIENSDIFKPYQSNKNNKKDMLKFIDFPGHISQRNRLYDYFTNCNSIVFLLYYIYYDFLYQVFLINSKQSILSESAHYLYNILINPKLYINKPNIMICINEDIENTDEIYKSLEESMYAQLNI